MKKNNQLTLFLCLNNSLINKNVYQETINLQIIYT